MSCPAPCTHEGDFADARRTACASMEPVFVPAAIHADDRGWSILNLLTGVLDAAGQINYSAMYPGIIKAWHRHERQTDFWLCVTGHLKAGVYRESDDQRWALVFGEKRPGVLIVPPTLWHGAATIGPDTAGLLYYVTHAYVPAAPDEQRRAHDSVPGFSWEPVHR